MRNLEIKISFNSLSELTPITPGGNTYRFIVEFKDSSGNPINHPRLPNTTAPIDVSPTSGANFSLNIPNNLLVTDNLVDIKAVVYRNATADCCFQEQTFTIPGENTPIELTIEPKGYFNLVSSNGLYSDNFIGDYEDNGVTYRQENGRTYRVFYWINDVPYANEVGGILYPKPFKNVPLKNKLAPTIRKVYYATQFQGNYVGTAGPQTYNEMDSILAWYGSWTNPQGDTDSILKTVSIGITTAGGSNLATGSIPWKFNPGWFSANKLVPQYYLNPALNIPDKPVTLQCYPTEFQYETNTNSKNETWRKLKEAGITNVWYVQWASSESGPNPTTNFHGVKPSHMLGTQPFGDLYGISPGDILTQAQSENYADITQLYDNMVVTHEFAEGSFPQWDRQMWRWYEARLNWRIQNETNPATGNPYVGIQILGEYGYGSERIEFYHLSEPNDTPMSQYFRDMTGDRTQILANIDLTPPGRWASYNGYLTEEYNYRGACVGAYYAISESKYGLNIGNYITEIFYNAIVQNNAAPNQPKGMFTASLMQSNSSSIDIWQKDSGTLLPLTNENGTVQGNYKVNYNYPHVPGEILKMQFFFSLLFYNSVYWWDAFGRKEINPDKWYDYSYTIDSGVIGSRWYADIQNKLAAADYEIFVCDYTVDGVDVNSTTTERRVSISRTGKQFFNNIYFNERAENKQGSLLAIPGTTPTFIWVNPYRSPHQTQNLIAKFASSTYALGEVPGMTLMVTDN